jgi:hypothetical protein
MEEAHTRTDTQEWYDFNWAMVQEFDLTSGDYFLFSNNQNRKQQWFDPKGRTLSEACALAFKLLRDSGQVDGRVRPHLVVDHFDVYQFIGCGKSPFRKIGDAYISFQKLIESGAILDSLTALTDGNVPMELIVEVGRYLWQPKWGWFTSSTNWYSFYLQGVTSEAENYARKVLL